MPSLHLRRDTLEQSFWLGGTGAQGARQRGGWLAISRRDDRIHAVRKGEVRPDTFPHRAFLCLHLLRRDAGSSLRHGGEVGEFFRARAWVTGVSTNGLANTLPLLSLPFPTTASLQHGGIDGLFWEQTSKTAERDKQGMRASKNNKNRDAFTSWNRTDLDH